MIYTITVAFCPAVQLAQTLAQYNAITDSHYVIQGYYPINKKKNNRDIEMICESFGCHFLDPGSDLGSAQSQNWALEKIGATNKDFFINLDPDSRCKEHDWEKAMFSAMGSDPNCVLISCWSKLWEPYKDRIKIDDNIGKAIAPIPFNLSMFRCSFINQIGGLKQMGEKWGELEGPFHMACEQNGKYHGYLMSYVEDESGKYMQDRQLLEYKDAYLRTVGEHQFTGSYEEFLKFKYPHLLATDTYIENNTEFK